MAPGASGPAPLRLPKILGIGLPKTGTSSLNAALRVLGIKAYHAPRAMRARYFRTDFHFDEDWGAITNLFEHAFPAIDVAYPGTRFLWTVRDVEPWLASIAAAFRRLDARQETTHAALIERLTAVQCSHYHEAILRHVHRFHALAVEDYFAGRPADVLRLDICGGEGWDALCAFLHLPVPDVPFPHANPDTDYQGA